MRDETGTPIWSVALVPTPPQMRSARENPATTLKFTRIVIQNSSFSGLGLDYAP
jgi:hypothetical protein